MPKRIVIVDNEDEANQIGNNILKELNCIALCTVSDSGEIISYEMEHKFIKICHQTIANDYK